MCDIERAISRAFTPPGTGGAEAAQIQARAAQQEQNKLLAQANVVAKESSDAAIAMQQEAIKRASAASVPMADSESARRAMESRMRRLMIGAGAGSKGGKLLGAAPVGYAELMGT